MSNPAGLSQVRDAWKSVLAGLLEELKAIYPFEDTISTELDFRNTFESLPSELHDDNTEGNTAFFSRFHVQILFFTRIIDEAVGLRSPESLRDVFWTTALAAIEAAFKQEFSFSEFKNVYKPLNKELPLFSSDLSQFPNSLAVQEPLQKIFEVYIRCYMELIRQLSTEDEEIDWEPVNDAMAQASNPYKILGIEWRDRFESAVEEQKSLVLNNLVGGHEDGDTRFVKLKDLGRGAYGAVQAVREVSTGTVYARKSIPISITGSDEKQIEQRVKNEVETMTKLRHNHIASINMHFRGVRYWSIIMSPVADCDLRVFLEKRCVGEGYPRNNMRLLDSWFGCLISALAYTHREMVKHEDIKPNNILIKGEKIYLTDFGTAKDFEGLESTTADFAEQGTPVYWAPQPRPWGRAADVFALGCVFSEMLTVRQRKTLQEYRKFRFNPTVDHGYAYKANLKRVKLWLTRHLPDIDAKHPVAQLICEQTSNMLEADDGQRLEANRVRHNMRPEESLFCASCF